MKPAVAILMERTISYADEVMPWIVGVAQYRYPMLFLPYGRTDTTRNRYAKTMLAGDYTHLVMLDIDHRHPVDVVERLLARIQEDPTREVIGALYFRRGKPYEPMMFRSGQGGLYSVIDWEPGQLLEVDAIGTGAIIIARSVFERLAYPYFRYEYEGDRFVSEDLYFCRVAREAGVRIWCDTALHTEHLLTGRINETVFRSYLDHHPEIVETEQEV